MSRVVIVGGGWAGCAAALAARQAGAREVIVLERADSLLGTGLVGGIMRNNGRYTAAEEMIALGAGTLFEVCDRTTRHRDIEFPGHKHASLYDVSFIEKAVRDCLLERGVEIWLLSRVAGLSRRNGSITAISLENATAVEADVFIDTTGSFGPQSFCTEFGNGCVMCIARCPTFGPRVSLTGLAGIAEKQGKKADGSIGAMSGSCEFGKESVDPGLVRELEEKGVLVIPMSRHLVHEEKLGAKCCQQYASAEYAQNVILLDTGRVKLMTSHLPLDQLQQVPGLGNVRYDDPYAGTVGNSMRFAALSPRDDAMQVQGEVDNLFCGGEKAGLLVGHTEAIVTGALAGHNAVRKSAGRELLELPDSLAVGDAVSYVRQRMQTEEGMREKYTFSGAVYFERMKARGLYTTDKAAIATRVAASGLAGVFHQPVN
ncbi:MAG: FAD-dependent oxidoreductase [Betaproteobacteria bacterium]|nr:FAD-dependent oxidoreductase [Betaproteobacteria bacterium]